jgi:hypothetical protein
MCHEKQKLTSLGPHGDSGGANKLIMITGLKPNILAQENSWFLNLTYQVAFLNLTRISVFRFS